MHAGGGWTQGKGNGFFMLSQRYIGGSWYANNNAEILQIDGLKSHVLTTHFYGEFGLTNRLDVIFHSPFITSASYSLETATDGLPALNDQNTGFGDCDMALKYKLHSGALHISATAQIGLPTGAPRPGLFGSVGTVIGDGEFNQMAKLDISAGLGKGYFSTMIGFNNRTNSFSDEFHLSAEAGLIKGNFIGILKLYWLESFENGDAAPAYVPGIYSNNLEYVAINPVFIYKKNNKGLILDLGFAPYLRNIIAAPSFNFGVFFELK
mgnify:FL=1